MAISITIKSEIDSRIVLYPMMRCLKPFGSCLICTANRQVIRLIDNEYEGDFRNFHIIFDPEGATDTMLENASVSPNEYTFVIYDNVAVTEQNKLIIPIGPNVSDLFHEEMILLGEDENTHIIKFGRGKPAKSAPKSKGSGKGKQEAPVTDDDIEAAAKRKFQLSKKDVEADLAKMPSLNYMSYDEMENLESTKTFGMVDKGFLKTFYIIFGKFLGIKEPNFVREVSRKDESSSSVK